MPIKPAQRVGTEVMLNPAQFVRARRLASQLAGIELVERHRALLGRRCGRLGLDSAGRLDELLDAAEQGEVAATRTLLGLITTNFTGFFRHARHFEIAGRHAREASERRGRARLWSAAAATGEEPWSLAIALIEAFERDDPDAVVLATDISPDALAIAAAGEYTESAMRGVEPQRRARFFGEAGPAGRWKVTPTVRALVEFRPLNLAAAAWSIDGPFDVILCRNALMYLEARHRHAALTRMASLLAPDGRLILDPTEHVGNAGHLFASRGNGVFAHREKFENGRARMEVYTAEGR